MGQINNYENSDTYHLYNKLIKRFIDILVSFTALILLFIPFIIISILIKIDSTGPIFFKQKRMGKNNKPFYIIKFRSMYTDTPHNTATSQLENAEAHITKIGSILRKTSLDELPQLINVFKGEMSLIGPRPLILKEKKVLRLRVEGGANKILPGITGLAQVHGRDEITDLEKARYDNLYAKQVSFKEDFLILCKTFSDVLHSRGIREGKQ